MRKTKIVCTVGPTTNNLEILKQLLQAGMNVARFNFSHGNHAQHKEMMDMIKEASRQTSIPVALLMDTKGPEIRSGAIKGGGMIDLEKEEKIILTTDTIEGNTDRLSISYEKLPSEVSIGTRIFMADGLICLEVEKIDKNDIHCVIISGGEIGSFKNVNVIGVKTSLPAVTGQDLDDIKFGIAQGVDFIAASFIRKPTDIKEIRAAIDIADSDVDIIAKIEDDEGLQNIDEIIRVSDGVMIARGDLGVQLPAEEIPLAQKTIIHKCNQHNKPVITATQMLESMVRNPMPTRAEVTDVANAIFDGTDAIMLSGETANGAYPIKATEMMHKIALQVENSRKFFNHFQEYGIANGPINIADTVARASFLVARDIHADAIVAPTLRGNTPKMISKYRPEQDILAMTPHEDVRRKLLLYWGVTPIITEYATDADEMLKKVFESGKKQGLIKPFDRLVSLSGIPMDSPIMLNNIRVHMVADVIGKGQRGYGTIFSGKIVKVSDLKEATSRIKGDGTEILLTKYIDMSFEPILKKVGGYILEEFSSMSWDDIYVMNPNLVALAGTFKAMSHLKDGQIVTIDGQEKIIYDGSCPNKKKIGA
ncbi:MAG: pyruvate kinase [Candidatus Omnitrophica bacterium]|nr:pyruvate kinase [Candidatus Omnitrophota bacterium]